MDSGLHSKCIKFDKLQYLPACSVPGGCLLQGECLLWGIPGPGGAWLGGCLLLGGAWYQGGLGPGGGIPACTEADPTCEQNHTCL